MAPGHAGPEQRLTPAPPAEAMLGVAPAPAGTARAEGDAVSAPRGETRAPSAGATSGYRRGPRPRTALQTARIRTRSGPTTR